MRELAGRTAVVTGAASGIGRSLARRFAREGMSVVLADVEPRVLDEATAEAGGLNDGNAVAVVTDVSDPEAVEALAARAFTDFGAVHVLCNNAGVFQGGLLWECTQADFDWTLGAAAHSAAASFVEEALAGTTAGGAHPEAVADLVVGAIREETFLVPTTGSYRAQILDRANALAERALPASAAFD